MIDIGVSRDNSSVVKSRGRARSRFGATPIGALALASPVAACASGFSITAAASTNPRPRRRDAATSPPRQGAFSRLLDQIVIVVALRIDQTAPRVARARISSGSVGAESTPSMITDDARHSPRGSTRRSGDPASQSMSPCELASRKSWKRRRSLRHQFGIGHADAVEAERAASRVVRIRDRPSSGVSVDLSHGDRSLIRGGTPGEGSRLTDRPYPSTPDPLPDGRGLTVVRVR